MTDSAAASVANSFSQRLREAIAQVEERVRNHFRNLHRYPELSWKEDRTAAYIEGVLSELGLTPRRVAGTGVVVDLPGPEGELARALRADIDAVAASEETGLPHASVNPGAMHACGHDAHTAILLGAADVLVQLEDLRPRPVRLIFQPAEESNPSGAPACIEEGVLEGVRDIVSLHVWPSLPTGTVGLRDGVVTAAADRWECVLRGPGGHSARPHETVDLVPLASRIISALVDVPRRVCDPLYSPIVVTVTRFHAGEAINVIPSEARFSGTVRSLDEEPRGRVATEMAKLVRAIAEEAGAQLEWNYERSAPMLTNDATLLEELRGLVPELWCEDTLVSIPSSSLGSEDFAYFAAEVPAVLLRLGCTPPGGERHPLHSAHFRVDESALPVGIAAMTGLALKPACTGER